MRTSTILFIFLMIFTVYAGDNYVHTLAVEWPGSICKGYKCTKEFLGNFDGRRWNLHGLWPNLRGISTCSFLFFCTNEQFDSNLISSDTLRQLDLQWVGLYSSTNDFRKHEYEKHGTCLPGYDQNGFFNLVLQLANKYSIYNALASAGIYPSDTQLISQTQVTQAIQNFLGITNSNASMTCIKDSSGKFHLGEVRFCLGDNLLPRNCDCSVANNKKIISQPYGALVACPTTFYYPNFVSVAQ